VENEEHKNTVIRKRAGTRTLGSVDVDGRIILKQIPMKYVFPEGYKTA
jgi:hypothetical protein